MAKNKMKDNKGEIDDYTRAIELNPYFVDAYYKRGIARYNLEDKIGGCEDINTAVKQGSNLAYAYLQLHCK
jgi:hypothetical protein